MWTLDVKTAFRVQNISKALSILIIWHYEKFTLRVTINNKWHHLAKLMIYFALRTKDILRWTNNHEVNGTI